MPDEETRWNAAGAIASVAAGIATRKLLESAWRRRQGIDPPTNPASPDTTWAQAIGWTLVSALAVGLARLVAERAAAGVWARRTGRLPRGIERTWA